MDKVNQVDLPKCFFPGSVEKIVNPTFFARRIDISYSAHKLVMVANLIAGKHVYDAQQVLLNVNKKGGDIVTNCL